MFRRFKSLLLFGTLVVVTGFSQPLEIPFNPFCVVDSVFWPPLIKARVLMLFESATRTIDVIAPSFVDEPLVDALIRAHGRGVAVRVISGNIDFLSQKLLDAGVNVSFFHDIFSCFAIVDERIVVTGSYCWFEESRINFGDVVFIQCEKVAREFATEFERLYSEALIYDFTLPATLTVTVPITKTGTEEVTLTPPQGKTLPAGDITLSLKETTLPAGLKVTFNPAKITVKAGDDQKKAQKAALTVEASKDATKGDYTLTVVAKGGGVTKETKLTVKVVDAPDYTLELSPTAVTVKQGTSATVTVTLKPNDTMKNITKESVDLTVVGAPAGAKVTVDPAKVPADKPTATIKIDVPATDVDAKDYTLTVTGKAPGIADKTASLKLTVQLVDFSLKAEPAVVTVAPGGTATITITITRTNHMDAVHFTVKGLPAGVTATFAPVSATGASASLTLSVAAEAALGTYTITVEGTDGVRTKTVNISLNILKG